MGVTSLSVGTTSSDGNGTGSEAVKSSSERPMKNCNDKENHSTNGSTARPGNEEELTVLTVSSDAIEIGASINVSD